MSETVYPVPENWAKNAWCDSEKYLAMYKRSIEDPRSTFYVPRIDS